MADSTAAAADAGICACCCIIIVSGLQTWCNLHAFGADGPSCCGGQRGCCGDRCASCFDHDDFDERLRKDQERKQDDKPISTQPPHTQEMTVQDQSECIDKPS
ncbi:hypothetical protein SCLCIDRAFT_783122 [Scleroderma citrinum Foug A]|uniref:Uncharacterized protein n=1 Tax=Scleroderma citrinum Foug A TaxID=1036808 RepID=A0A0C3E362_9AGAM|nr:hypothetical protein SCLCIDRAFT_783122 [Scleroderma citrinum Foug A]